MRLKCQRQDLHFLDEDGMVACNPRDREAAHRAGIEGIATQNRQAVTCRSAVSRFEERGTSGGRRFRSSDHIA
jgi:hypothetical protein